jgi:hypothetical protein
MPWHFLLSVLWQPSWLKASIDAGIRRGCSCGAPDWLCMTGLTFGFPCQGLATGMQGVHKVAFRMFSLPGVKASLSISP